MEKKKMLKPFILCIFWGYLLSKITFEFGFIAQLESIVSIGCYFYALRCLKCESTSFKNAYFLSVIMVVYSVFMLFYPYIVPFDVPSFVIYVVVVVRFVMEISIFIGMKTYSQKMDLQLSIGAMVIMTILGLVYRGDNELVIGIFVLCLIGVVLYNIYECYQEVKENSTTIILPYYTMQPVQLFLLLSAIAVVISGVFMYRWPYYQYSYIENKDYNYKEIYNYVGSYHFETTDHISKKLIIRDVDVYETTNQYIYLFKQRIPLNEKYSFMDAISYVAGNQCFGLYDVYDEKQRYLSYDIRSEFNDWFMEEQSYKRTYLNPQAEYIEIINEYTFPKKVENSNGELTAPYTEISFNLSLYPYGKLYKEDNRTSITMIYLIDGTKITIQQ